ncbi:hypothetical protein UFOVP1475_11 [uncultured Caudovirales phage]|uniref:Methyltransferase domain containing protein n=1 Tax=uncultured Caudovirales phage TaxID=2100421 RepID=A0A6J5SKX2_9CAUD|nr:hypothetical protein UFOVP1475_11 [uncultured Caudovirales phage]
MREKFDFAAYQLNALLQQTISDKIYFSEITNWHTSHPYLRLNYYNRVQMSQCLGIYVGLNPDYLSTFTNIIEIGTYNGGLTSWLFDNLKEGGKLISYDIDGTINHTGRTDIDFRVDDCFADQPFKDIIELIQSEGRTLVLCDGGDKPKEFNQFSKYLKPGDVIMAHDYCVDAKHWKEITDYWQWPYEFDTTYEMIKDAVIENNLRPYKNDEMNFLLWTSYIKQ